MNTDTVEELTVRLSADPFHIETNFALAEEYFQHDQLASAVTFYLRCVEYGQDLHTSYVYTSLLRLSECFEKMNDRNWTVTGSLLQAIAYMPHRREAWFYLSRYYERHQQWQDAYTYASVGLAQRPSETGLPAKTDYSGMYCLDFEKAVSAWWIGRKDESLSTLQYLQTQALPEEYRNAVDANLARIS